MARKNLTARKRLTKEQRTEYLDWIFRERITVGHFAKKFSCSKGTLYQIACAERKKIRASAQLDAFWKRER